MPYAVAQEFFPSPLTIPDEVLYQQFKKIMTSIYFDEAYMVFCASKFSLHTRKKIQMHVKAIMCALWRLVIVQAFPKRASNITLHTLRCFLGEKIITSKIQELYEMYWAKLQKYKDSDFTPLATLAIELISKTKRKIYPLTVALYIRSLYTLIQERFIDLSVVE